MSENELLQNWRREKEDAARAKLREGIRTARGLLRIERTIKAELLAALEIAADALARAASVWRPDSDGRKEFDREAAAARAAIVKAKEIGGEPF